MSVKQDRSGARTPADLERKYNFGKTFAEMLGLINDNRDKVDSVESSLRDEIKEQSTTLMRDTEQIVMEATKTMMTEIEVVDGKVLGMQESIDGVNESLEDVQTELVELTSTVEMKVDADSVDIIVDQKIAGGVNVDHIETRTGYTFDSEGLKIAKYGEEMTNLIDNSGMYVLRDDDVMLSANNKGVDAVNLHAKTYLIVGSGDGRSRFEDYGIDRTGCFWIG